jgi:AraC family transcriptional regulator of adaptative response/methylated-DNA-[protein]-cysteine methyltransferase
MPQCIRLLAQTRPAQRPPWLRFAHRTRRLAPRHGNMPVPFPVVRLRNDSYSQPMARTREETNNGRQAACAMPDAETLYKALVEKDPQFEGIFVAGVKTTGIFCRPTCAARKPKLANVEFFSTPTEALQYGYRPCKLCKPMEPPAQSPHWLPSLLDEVCAHPELRVADSDLRDRDLEPATVRRWFQKNYGMTFQAYQRLVRLSHAFGRIRDGDAVAAAAYGAGFESLSAFSDLSKKAAGFSPGMSRQRSIAVVTRIESPIGPLLAVANEAGLCLLEFVDRRMLETQLKRVRSQLDVALLPGTNAVFATVREQLDEYFAGSRRSFDVPLVITGTAFQKQVWEALREIPYGQTRSYGKQATLIGRPTAVRAVARANGDNRFAIIIPCHRVVGADGSLTGYGGGIWRKRFLLDLEQHHVAP